MSLNKYLLGLLFVLFGFSFLFAKELFAVEASLTFAPESVSVDKGQEFDIKVMIDTAGQKVGGAGAIIKFNPQNLEALSVTPGGVFSDYPTASFDNTQGKIVVSGIVASIDDLYQGSGEFATLKFVGKSQGSGEISFDYVPGSTIDSNIAVTFGNGDILGRVNNVSIVISNEGSFQPLENTPVDTSISDVTESNQPGFLVSLLRKLGVSESFLQKLGLVEGSSDLYAPITNQPPVNNLNQNQQNMNEMYQSSRNPAETRYLFILAFALLVFFILIILFIRRRKKKPESISSNL